MVELAVLKTCRTFELHAGLWIKPMDPLLYLRRPRTQKNVLPVVVLLAHAQFVTRCYASACDCRLLCRLRRHIIQGSTADETVDGVECDTVLSDLNFDVLTTSPLIALSIVDSGKSWDGNWRDGGGFGRWTNCLLSYVRKTNIETVFPLQIYFSYYFNCCGSNM